MDGITTFTSDKEPLHEMLKAIASGKTQLPEFQRGWVWNDLHIQSLLASVSLSYPIGAVMMLENGNPEVRFKPRPVEGVELEHPLQPEQFILDGQQRLTALFQSLCLNKAVKTQDIRKKDILRWYYIDMAKALRPNGDREDAVISLPEDRKIKNFRNEVLEDYSTPQLEYTHGLFPLAQVFDCADWRTGYNAHWDYASERTKLFDQFERIVVKRFEQYMVPVIKLLKGTPKVAVCQVFEKVNTGGVSLTVFELVTATFAADGYNLREDWEGVLAPNGRDHAPGRRHKLHNTKTKVLQAVDSDELLQVIALLTTYHRKTREEESAVGCKRPDILKLNLSDYKKWVEPATQGFIKAGKLLFQQNIFSARDIPYSTQLVPLAALLAILGDKADNHAVRDKLIRWYWCGVFGELYAGAVETRFARDVVDVTAWVKGGGEPLTIEDCNFTPSRLLSLRTRNSAAYKGLSALLMRDGCQDFRSGERIDVQTYFDEAVDIHHVFPRDHCKRLGINEKLCDCIVNKTPLSYRTNRIIGGAAPSTYLRRLREKTTITEEQQDRILASHVIDVPSLKQDDFDAFFKARKEALLSRIEAVTGKKISRETEGDAESETNDEAGGVAEA